jgi:hypothetical protein
MMRRAAGIAALVLLPFTAANAAPQVNDEFFILSSIDIARSRLILKRPTEVTIAMSVTPTTIIRDERGAALRLANLRAGDTLYIVATSGASGEPVAVTMRRGPMTLAELHRRYMLR